MPRAPRAACPNPESTMQGALASPAPGGRVPIGVVVRAAGRFAALPAALLLAGCVSAHTTMLTPHRYTPVPAPDVHVFLHEDELPEECVRVALIHAEGNVNWTNERQMIEAARKQAGKAGGNALVLRRVEDPSTVTRIAAELIDGLPADRKGQMLAFRWPPPDAPSEAAAGPG